MCTLQKYKSNFPLGLGCWQSGKGWILCQGQSLRTAVIRFNHKSDRCNLESVKVLLKWFLFGRSVRSVLVLVFLCPIQSVQSLIIESAENFTMDSFVVQFWTFL